MDKEQKKEFYSSGTQEDNRTTETVQRGKGVSILSIILSFVVLFLLAVYTVRVGMGKTDLLPSFGELLHTLSSSPQVDMNFDTIGVILGDWGVFNFFRDFINFFLNILNFLVWLGKSLLNCLIYIFYFVRWIFVS